MKEVSPAKKREAIFDPAFVKLALIAAWVSSQNCYGLNPPTTLTSFQTRIDLGVAAESQTVTAEKVSNEAYPANVVELSY